MKRLVLALAIVLMASVAIASDKQPETKYEVVIEVKYNAVTVKEADRIIGNALRNHTSACKLKVNSRKLSNDIEWVIYEMSGTWLSEDYDGPATIYGTE